MDDANRNRAFVVPAKPGRSGRKTSVRITLTGQRGGAIVRLTCPEEAISWDSGL